MRASERTAGTAFPADRPVFYYVTDRHSLEGGSLLASMKRAIGWGVDFIQIREKDLGDRDLFELTGHAVALVRGTHCRILVNGRADIALAAGALGVHLPSSGLKVGDLPNALRRRLILGVSTHSAREFRSAANDGADYVLLGPVFPTASKLSYGPPLGLTLLERVCRESAIPVLAIGGIDANSIAAVLAAGAAGVAGISLFQGRAEYLKAFSSCASSCRVELAGATARVPRRRVRR